MGKIRHRLTVLGLAAMITSGSVYANDYSGHWASHAIDQWKAYGVVKGYEDGSFRPSQPITRAEFAAILGRVCNLNTTEGAPTYLDLLGNTKWYVTAINQVNAANLMYIEGSSFLPNQLMTREEAAYAIAKAYQVEMNDESATRFIDDEQIAHWARKAVKALSEQGYIGGNPDGSFKPQGTLTRAELVTMLNNITGQMILAPGIYTQALKGNIIVNSPGVILENMTIEGNLYLTQGLGEQAIILENVHVTGGVYIQGGNLHMKGSFNEVVLGSGKTLHLESGNIETLHITRGGATVQVDALAQIDKLNAIADYELIGEGKVNGISIGEVQDLSITEAGVWVNDHYEALPVRGNKIIIDVPALQKQFKASDELAGLTIATNLPQAILSSERGEMTAGAHYTFKEAEKALGMIREIAIEAGINPGLAVSYILGGETLTIGSLLEDYEMAQQLAASMNIQLQDSYVFTRMLHHPNGKATHFTIELRLKQ